ncbi:hypothetical protein [Paenibacillus sedimenti]|uniref:Uncharacterized protein n=1 Tax=Paenibacillus sedimenti TaxID=2770274 RepID=A0A926KTK0_9BACL|nr:hypothetical protein [Paenibacillus sedimenti]MBD0381983.1 hypothetical protein [Paenibacillus sedimenti]
MVLQLDIPVSTFTIFSMLVLSLSLFRIPIKMKWPFVMLASLSLSCFSYILHMLNAQMLSPIIMIFMQAVVIHYLFGLRKLHSLMVVFLGALGYTIYLAIVLFLAPVLTRISLNDYFYAVVPSYRILKIIAALLALLSGYILIRKRLGFTVRMEISAKSLRSPRNSMLTSALLFTLALFSITYYAVTLHLAFIFYFAAGFCILLAWILYLLFKKEMEEN